MALIDYSGTLSQETLEMYATVLSKDIFYHLGPKDRLTIIPIDEAAITRADRLYEIDFAQRKDFTKKTDPLTHKQDSIHKRMNRFRDQFADSLFQTILTQKQIRAEFSGLTDICGAIAEAAKLIEDPRADSKYEVSNVLVVLSDMLHENDDFNMRTTNPSDTARFGGFLRSVTEEAVRPDLTGVRVFVMGRTGKTNEQVGCVQNFWEKYFSATNATLVTYAFDCRSDIAKLMKK